MRQDKKIIIGLIGTDFCAQLLARQINKSNTEFSAVVFNPNFKDLKRCQILHGFFTFGKWKTYALAKLLGKKTICHWIGSDIYQMRTQEKAARLAHRTQCFVDLNFAVADHQLHYLADYHIPAKIMPNLSFIKKQLPPLPRHFTVLSYLPQGYVPAIGKLNEHFYGSKIIYRLAREFPEVNFLILSGPEAQGKNIKTIKQVDYPNVKFLGWQKDINKWYAASNVLVRITEDDGLPKMVIEALALGRQVIYPWGLPYTHRANNYEQAVKALIKIKADFRFNEAGADFVVRNYSPQNLLPHLFEYYRQLL